MDKYEKIIEEIEQSGRIIKKMCLVCIIAIIVLIGLKLTNIIKFEIDFIIAGFSLMTVPGFDTLNKREEMVLELKIKKELNEN